MAADLGAALEKALWEVHQLERTVQTITDGSVALTSQRINTLTERLADVRAAASQCAVSVPASAVTCVDEGRNPDTYFVDCSLGTSAANQATKGRVHNISSLHDALVAEALAWSAAGTSEPAT